MKESDNHIKTEAPILFGLKKENRLDVPKGYFNELQEQLLQIPAKKQPKIIYFKKRLIYFASIASVLAFVFFGIKKFKQQQETAEFNILFNQLTAESFETELLEPENQIDLYIDFNDNQKHNN